MKSRWFKLKGEAIKLRRRGYSVRNVETKLGIPRSTLSGWLRQVKIHSLFKKRLEERGRQSLIRARAKAVVWHNKQKENRMRMAEGDAEKVLHKLNLTNTNVIELALSLLYLGEGSKKNSETSIGNSDPLILKFFVTVLINVYKVEMDQITCYLHLRSDQDIHKMKKYWSKELRIPISNFGGVSVDKRTIGTSTYESYKGVCVLCCGNVAIQRKLVYLSKKFCQKVIHTWAVSSFS